jgi:hypothetical protein
LSSPQLTFTCQSTHWEMPSSCTQGQAPGCERGDAKGWARWGAGREDQQDHYEAGMETTVPVITGACPPAGPLTCAFALSAARRASSSAPRQLPTILRRAWRTT